jgi:hypothetical protein
LNPFGTFESNTIFVPAWAADLYAEAVATGSTGNVSITVGFFAITVSTSLFCLPASKLAIVVATIRMPSSLNSSRAPAVTAASKSEVWCQTSAAV